jgi:hypothetical protein
VRSRYFVAILGLLTVSAAHVAAAQDGSTDSLARRETAVFRRLQRAVSLHDTAAIASLMVYPVRVNRSQRSHFLINSRADLRSRFGEVFPDTVRRVILQQNPDSLFISWRGSMVGNGVVWIAGICSDDRAMKCRYGIMAINLPGVGRSSSPHPPSNVR